MRLTTSSFWNPLIAGPLVLFAVIAFNVVQSSGNSQEDTIKARNCAANVQVITAPVVAQIGKTRTAKLAKTAAIPALIAQTGKERPATGAANSLVQNVRCLPRST